MIQGTQLKLANHNCSLIKQCEKIVLCQAHHKCTMYTWLHGIYLLSRTTYRKKGHGIVPSTLFIPWRTDYPGYDLLILFLQGKGIIIADLFLIDMLFLSSRSNLYVTLLQNRVWYGNILNNVNKCFMVCSSKYQIHLHPSPSPLKWIRYET